jgi:shikimate dehydrogenase
LSDPGRVGGTRRCAVLGHPIGHSLSPVLHRAAYGELGLNWSYEALDVGEPDLAEFLDGLDGSWRGLSLTMPLKRTVVPLVDELVGPAAQARAANTVVLEGGRRTGHNTDVPGAAAALVERQPGSLERAVVLGGGATAASVLLALADLGCAEATLVVRDPGRAADPVTVVGRHPRAPRLGVRTLTATSHLVDPAHPVDVLVSTIPAGAQDEAVLAQVETAGLVFDVLYDPWPTPLAARARESGVPLVGGLDLLVHQAALQVELMTGVAHAPLAVMRAAGEAALAARSAAGAGENAR